MRLLSVTLRDFRNLEHVALEPSARATVVVGPNGQGKTNLLEGIYYLCALRALRASKLSELVRFGCEGARVSGRFLLQGAVREICVEIAAAGTRAAFVDGKRARSLEEYFGGVSVVGFTPDDLAVVKGGPDGRRAFLDRAVFNRFPAYLNESRDYARALKSRNRLLKEGAGKAYLEAYDAQLARLGARLWIRRRALLAELAPRAAATFANIARIDRPARYRYAPAHLEADFATADEEKLRQSLSELLARRFERDLERGFTSVGPHADDLSLELGELGAKSFASQGQQRALVLAWKVAEIENLSDALGQMPLLLLDDVSSELDPERNAYLMGYLARSGAQVFLTTTDPDLVRPAAGEGARWYEVREGRVLARAS